MRFFVCVFCLTTLTIAGCSKPEPPAPSAEELQQPIPPEVSGGPEEALPQ